MMDGNVAFKMLEKMTEEERGNVFFPACYGDESVFDAYYNLLEWDDESNDNLEAVTGNDKYDTPEPGKVFTREELNGILQEALLYADDSDQYYDFIDKTNSYIQSCISRLLEKKAGKKVIECVEDGRKYSRRELLDEMRERQENGSIDAEWTLSDYIRDITGKNGACRWIDANNGNETGKEE